MAITLDFATTGVLNIEDATSGDTIKAIHLRLVTTVGQENATFSSDATIRDDSSIVSIGILGVEKYNIDIRDIDTTPYATTQDLVDAILAAIEGMYSGGGGGGVTSVTAASPLSSTGGTTPQISLPGGLPSPSFIGYTFDSGIGGNPGSGEWQANNANWTSVTELYFHAEPEGGSVGGDPWSPLALMFERAYICVTGNDGRYWFFNVSGAISLASSVYTIPVGIGSDASALTLPSNGEKCRISLLPRVDHIGGIPLNISGITDGQRLQYDSGTGFWIAVTP